MPRKPPRKRHERRKTSRPRRRSIVEAVYRWEFLRRNPEYQRDAQRWIDRDAAALGLARPLVVEDLKWDSLKDDWVPVIRTVTPVEMINPIADCFVDTNGVIAPPLFDFEADKRYRSDCERWGLRLLFHPRLRVPAEDMARFPIFTDSPQRQFGLKRLSSQANKALSKGS